MKTRNENALPKKSLKGRYFSALIFFCLLFCQQSIEASDTHFINQWLNSKSSESLRCDIHIGFFHLDLTTPNLPDAQRITTREDFNLDSVSFRNLLSVYFSLQNQRSDSLEERPSLRRFALSILLELFNRNLQSAYQSPGNRQQLQQRFTEFYNSFTTSPLNPKWAQRHQRRETEDVTFRGYFDTSTFISQNDFVNANNGLMALMYALLAPFIQQNTSDSCPGQSLQFSIMHNNFDLIQNAFIRKSACRRSTNSPEYFNPANPDLSMFQGIDSLTRHIESNNLQGELLLLMSLRSLAFYAYQTLTLRIPVQTDFSEIIRENLTADLSSVLVRNLFEGWLQAYDYRSREGQLGNADDCGMFAATSGVSGFLWMRAPIAISSFQRQDQTNTQRLFNALLGGDPVFTVSQQRPVPTIEQPLPIGSEAIQTSTASSESLHPDALPSTLAELLNRVMQTISTNGLTDDHDFNIDRRGAIERLIENLCRTPPLPPRRTRPLGNSGYRQLAAGIAEMHLHRAGAERTSSGNNETFIDNLGFASGTLRTLILYMTDDGRLRQNPPPPQEVTTLYAFLRGYLSHNTESPNYFPKTPEQVPNVQQQQSNANDPLPAAANLPVLPPEPTQPPEAPPEVPKFAAGNTCIICFEEKNRLVGLPCGHGNFCHDCIKKLERTRNQHYCPLCRAPYEPDKRRSYKVNESENNQNANDKNPNSGDQSLEEEKSHYRSDDQME